MSDLQISNLSFAYHHDRVLQNVTMHCGASEFVSILGASGCGKSTLLRVASDLLPATEGEVERGAGKLGFVFQKPTLCPWLTVEQNVGLPRKLQGTNRAEREELSRNALELVGLSPRDAKKLPHQLSGGMQMRASLARAISTQPQFMMMDEPFSALDEILRQQLTEKCHQLWSKEAWTTLLVTHNVQDAVFLSQRIYILAGQPATIVDEIEIPLGTRTPETRTSAEYQRLVSEVGRRLRTAVELAAPHTGAR